MDLVQEAYLEIPPVTRAYTSLCVMLTVIVQFDLVSPFQLYFNPILIWKNFQVFGTRNFLCTIFFYLLDTWTHRHSILEWLLAFRATVRFALHPFRDAFVHLGLRNSVQFKSVRLFVTCAIDLDTLFVFILFRFKCD